MTAGDCAVTGDVPADERAAAFEDCRYARARFAELFGSPAPGVDITLADTAGFAVSTASGRVAVAWYSRAALASGNGELARRARDFVEGSRIITHELLHVFFQARSGDPGDVESASRYGTRRPDWFDEGVAVWGETDSLRARRWEELGELPDSAFDLRVLAVTVHPGLGREPAEGVTMTVIESAMRCRTAECTLAPNRLPEGWVERRRSFQDGRILVDTVPESLVNPPGIVARHFYPLSYSLVRYFHERGGTAAIAALERRFEGGWPSPDSVFRDIPRVPARLEAIEADWRVFVRKTPG